MTAFPKVGVLLHERPQPRPRGVFGLGREQRGDLHPKLAAVAAGDESPGYDQPFGVLSRGFRAVPDEEPQHLGARRGTERSALGALQDGCFKLRRPSGLYAMQHKRGVVLSQVAVEPSTDPYSGRGRGALDDLVDGPRVECALVIRTRWRPADDGRRPSFPRRRIELPAIVGGPGEQADRAIPSRRWRVEDVLAEPPSRYRIALLKVFPRSRHQPRAQALVERHAGW